MGLEVMASFHPFLIYPKYPAMIIAGGGKSRSIGMVEIFAPPTDQQPAVQCKLLNMPGATERYGLTLDGTTACGGGAEKNCLTFTIDGTWTETDNLTELRNKINNLIFINTHYVIQISPLQLGILFSWSFTPNGR